MRARDARLFATSVRDEHIDGLKEYPFHRITPNYILFISDTEPELMHMEITAEYEGFLSEADRAWFMSCVAVMLQTTVEESEQDISEELNKRLDLLEKTLEESRRKLED